MVREPDLHLQPRSPAIARATCPGLPDHDIEGNPRPAGSGGDLGAYEYGVRFIRGDVNRDGVVDIADAIALLNYLYLGGARPSCEDAADADDSARLDLADVILILSYLYIGGEEPAAPFPGPGIDPSPDELACRSLGGLR